MVVVLRLLRSAPAFLSRPTAINCTDSPSLYFVLLLMPLYCSCCQLVSSYCYYCGAGQAWVAQSDALPLSLAPFVELEQAAAQERPVGGGGCGGGKNGVPGGPGGEIR